MHSRSGTAAAIASWISARFSSIDSEDQRRAGRLTSTRRTTTSRASCPHAASSTRPSVTAGIHGIDRIGHVELRLRGREVDSTAVAPVDLLPRHKHLTAHREQLREEPWPLQAGTVVAEALPHCTWSDDEPVQSKQRRTTVTERRAILHDPHVTHAAEAGSV